jgi:hypothetical protein
MVGRGLSERDANSGPVARSRSHGPCPSSRCTQCTAHSFISTYYLHTSVIQIHEIKLYFVSMCYSSIVGVHFNLTLKSTLRHIQTLQTFGRNIEVLVEMEREKFRIQADAEDLHQNPI